MTTSQGTAKRFGWQPSEDVAILDRNGKKIGKRAGYDSEPTRLCYLYMREVGKSEVIDDDSYLVFKLNPQSMARVQGIKVGVQHGRNGYVVTEGGHQEPRFVLEGHFGWVLKRPDASFTDLKAILGNRTVPERDGMQGWNALFALVQRYVDANQRRMAAGKALIELVWADPINGDNGGVGWRWVVTPSTNIPLSRTVDRQSLFQYKLELIGIYDDIVAAIPIRLPTGLQARLGPTFRETDRPYAATPLPVVKDQNGGGGTVAPAEATGGTLTEVSPISTFEFRLEPVCIAFTQHFLYKRYSDAKLGEQWLSGAIGSGAASRFIGRRTAARRLLKYIINRPEYDDPDWHVPAYSPAVQKTPTRINVNNDTQLPVLDFTQSPSPALKGIQDTYALFTRYLPKVWASEKFQEKIKTTGIPIWLNDVFIPAEPNRGP